jgi:hypothetical protein
LGFHQSDIFHGIISCSGAEFYQSVWRTAVTDADLQSNPKPYGLMDAESQEVQMAKETVKFALTTGSGDFRQHFIEDIYNGGFKNEDFKAVLFDVSGMGHGPCNAKTLREALNFIEKS